MRFAAQFKSLPPAVWTLCAVTLINRAGTMVLPFLVLYLTKDVALPAETAGSVLLAYGIGAVAASPVAGKLTDRVGPRVMMQASLFGSGLLLFVFPLARSLASIFVVTFVWAFVSEAFRPASMSVIGDLVGPEHRKSAFSMIRFAINLGMSIGPVAGGVLAGFSFGWLFLIDGVTSLLAGVALTLWFAVPEHHERESSEITSRWGPFADIRMVTFTAGTLVIGMLFFQSLAAMPLYIVRDLGFSETALGLLLTINTILIVFLEIPINLSTTHWPHVRTLFVGTLLSAIGFGGLVFASDAWTIAATIVVWTFGEMILFPGMSAFVSDLAPASRRGEYMGFFQLAWSGAFLAGPWLGTIVLERLGPTPLWAGCFAVGLAASAIFWLTSSRVREPAG